MQDLPYIVKIPHFGVAFNNSDCAKLILTGVFYHYVLIIP